MANIVVGVFDEYVNAEAAREELLGMGLTERQVRIAERQPEKQATEQSPGDHDRFWSNIRDYFGIDEDEDNDERHQPVGGAVLTIIAGREKLDTITDIILRYEPATINQQSPESGSAPL